MRRPVPLFLLLALTACAKVDPDEVLERRKAALALPDKPRLTFKQAMDLISKADLPNGGTASKEAMLAGQKSVKAYMATMEEYLTCIDTSEKDAVAALANPSDEELASREAAITKKYNAAVEDMELTAAKFNEEVRDYKSQSE